MNETAAPPSAWSRFGPRPDLRALAAFLAVLAGALLAWDVAVRAELVSPLVPSPGKVWDEAVAALGDPFYLRGTNSVGIGWHLLASLGRVLLGCGLAALVAVPLGFLLGASSTLGRALDPFVQVLRPVSPLAWLPIGLAVLQDTERTAIFVIAMAAVWPMLLNTILGVRSVAASYLALARPVAAGRLTVARRILLPAALPSILTGVRLSLGM